MAPPTMAMFRMPDPLPVSGPSSATPRREDRGEHDRVEEPNGQNRPHRRMSAQQHGSCDQCCRSNRAQSQQMSGLHPPRECRAEKASDHRPTPVERNITGRRDGGETRNRGQTEIVHQKASDGNFRAHIGENPDRGEDQIGMLPDRIRDLQARAVRGEVRVLAASRSRSKPPTATGQRQ